MKSTASSARLVAAQAFATVLEQGLTLDEAMDRQSTVHRLEPRDRAFALAIALASFRHKGEIEAAIARHLAKPLPRKSGLAAHLLTTAAAQLLVLGSPAHAVIDEAVRIAKSDRNATHFSGLINAVLRKIAGGPLASLVNADGWKLNTPGWLRSRWEANYGSETARRMIEAQAKEPPLDITVKSDPALWAERLGGIQLPSGTVRLPAPGKPVPELPGFQEGAWWIQDAAAALPVRLLGDVKCQSALDLCAAPGGKTMQLLAGGARVTAVDISGKRLQRLRSNLVRTGFEVDVVEADVLSLDLPAVFDVVVLDTPCSATGTIRRHPELPYLRNAGALPELAAQQTRMLQVAAARVAAGGRLLYCTCSLEPEEGENQIRHFLTGTPEFRLEPPEGIALPGGALTSEGWVRLRPDMNWGEAEGLDGFFIAILRRRG